MSNRGRRHGRPRRAGLRASSRPPRAATTSRAPGTSMAAPHVAGALVLLASARPDLGPDALQAALLASARRGVAVTTGTLDVAGAMRRVVSAVALAQRHPRERGARRVAAKRAAVRASSPGGRAGALGAMVRRGVDTATFIYMMLVLKLPILALALDRLVGDQVDARRRLRSDDDGGLKTWPHGDAPAAQAAPAHAARTAIRHRRRPRASAPTVAQGRESTHTLDPARRLARHAAGVGALRRHDPPPRRGGSDQGRPVGSGDDPAGLDRPAPRQLVPRVPQPPRAGDRPARPAAQPHGADRPRRRRAVHRAPGRVRPRAHGGARRDPRRHRRAHRGQELPRPPRAHRARDRRLRRPGLQRHADARGHEPHAHPDRAVAGPADRPAVVHGARRARRAALRSPGPRQPLPRAGGGDREPLRGRPCTRRRETR